MTYTSPTVTDLGSVVDLTQQQFNKIGGSPDGSSQNPNVVGSFVPYP